MNFIDYFNRKKPAAVNEEPDGHMLALEPRILFDVSGLTAGLGVGMEAFDPGPADERDADPLLERSRQLKETIQRETDETRSLFHQVFAEESRTTPSPIPTGNGREIIFVDAAVRDSDRLLQGVDDDIRVVHLRGDRDGVTQITQILSEENDLDAIHILSHGQPGRLQLGSGSLSRDNLTYQVEEVMLWGEALSENGDILLYGCDVGAGAEGRAFLESLADVADADVAASDDATGATGRGGDWELESKSGTIESVSPITAEARKAWDGLLATPAIISTGLDGATANGSSSDPDISDDGRFVVFASSASNLVAGDNNDQSDIFLRDNETGLIKRVNVNANGEVANALSWEPAISGNGRFVVFRTTTDNPEAGNDSLYGEIFLYDNETGSIKLVSVDSQGNPATDGASYNAHISADGRYVVFGSSATDLYPGGYSQAGVYRHDTVTGETRLFSVLADGTPIEAGSSGSPRISDDGGHAVYVFHPDSTDPTIPAFSQIAHYDFATGVPTPISVIDGQPIPGNNTSADISGDGRQVVFQSTTDEKSDIHLYDTGNDRHVIVSVNNPEITLNQWNHSPRFSADGGFVVFQSSAQSAPGAGDLIRYDIQTGKLDRLATGRNFHPILNRDGQQLVFASSHLPEFETERREHASIFQLDLREPDNHAPVLDSNTVFTLPTIAETATSHSGILVSELIGDHISDADGNDPRGIAVTGSDDSRGRWQYSTDGGGTWTDFQNVSDQNATLLAADADTRVRFLPSSGFDVTNLDQSMADLAMDLTIDREGYFVVRDPGDPSNRLFTASNRFQQGVGLETPGDGLVLQGWEINEQGENLQQGLRDVDLDPFYQQVSQPTTLARIGIQFNADHPPRNPPAIYDPNDAESYDFSTTVMVFDHQGDRHFLDLHFVHLPQATMATVTGQDGKDTFQVELSESTEATFTFTPEDGTNAISADAVLLFTGEQSVDVNDLTSGGQPLSLQAGVRYVIGYSLANGSVTRLVGDDGVAEAPGEENDRTWAWHVAARSSELQESQRGTGDFTALDLDSANIMAAPLGRNYQPGKLVFDADGNLEREGSTPITFLFQTGSDQLQAQQILFDFGRATAPFGDPENDFSKASGDARYQSGPAAEDNGIPGGNDSRLWMKADSPDAARTIQIRANGIAARSPDKITIDADGLVTGHYFEIGQTRTLYRLAVARFDDPAQLEKRDNEIMAATAASGQAQLLQPTGIIQAAELNDVALPTVNDTIQFVVGPDKDHLQRTTISDISGFNTSGWLTAKLSQLQGIDVSLTDDGRIQLTGQGDNLFGILHDQTGLMRYVGLGTPTAGEDDAAVIPYDRVPLQKTLTSKRFSDGGIDLRFRAWDQTVPAGESPRVNGETGIDITAAMANAAQPGSGRESAFSAETASATITVGDLVASDADGKLNGAFREILANADGTTPLLHHVRFDGQGGGPDGSDYRMTQQGVFAIRDNTDTALGMVNGSGSTYVAIDLQNDRLALGIRETNDADDADLAGSYHVAWMEPDYAGFGLLTLDGQGGGHYKSLQDSEGNATGTYPVTYHLTPSGRLTLTVKLSEAQQLNFRGMAREDGHLLSATESHYSGTFVAGRIQQNASVQTLAGNYFGASLWNNDQTDFSHYQLAGRDRSHYQDLIIPDDRPLSTTLTEIASTAVGDYPPPYSDANSGSFNLRMNAQGKITDDQGTHVGFAIDNGNLWVIIDLDQSPADGTEIGLTIALRQNDETATGDDTGNDDDEPYIPPINPKIGFGYPGFQPPPPPGHEISQGGDDHPLLKLRLGQMEWGLDEQLFDESPMMDESEEAEGDESEGDETEESSEESGDGEESAEAAPPAASEEDPSGPDKDKKSSDGEKSGLTSEIETERQQRTKQRQEVQKILEEVYELLSCDR